MQCSAAIGSPGQCEVTQGDTGDKVTQPSCPPTPGLLCRTPSSRSAQSPALPTPPHTWSTQHTHISTSSTYCRDAVCVGGSAAAQLCRCSLCRPTAAHTDRSRSPGAVPLLCPAQQHGAAVPSTVSSVDENLMKQRGGGGLLSPIVCSPLPPGQNGPSSRKTFAPRTKNATSSLLPA